MFSLVSRHPKSAFRTVMGAPVDLSEATVWTGSALLSCYRYRPFDPPELCRILAGQHIGHQSRQQPLGDTLSIALCAFAAPAQRNAHNEVAARLVPEADRASDYRVEPREAIAVNVAPEERQGKRLV